MNATRQILLIVEDEPINTRILVELLRDAYDLRTVRTGDRALALARSEPPPDLILLDVGLPDMDGYEVCRLLQADPKTQGIPIIFITGHGEESDEVRGFQAGAVDYVTKPFSPVIVQARVRTHAELARLRTTLERQSNTDGLTAIPNRRRFEAALETAWSMALRSHAWLACIMIDIDHFKRFNDHCGHREGDACLLKVATAMAGTLRRKTDLLARYGGEEFACLMPGTDLAGARSLAEQFASAVRRASIPHPAEGGFVAISQGLAALRPERGMDPECLVREADKALYAAKAAGRDCIRP